MTKEEIKRIKDEVKSLKGQTIGTVYGPSEVVGLTRDQKHVKLLEFGEELYTVTLENWDALKQ